MKTIFFIGFGSRFGMREQDDGTIGIAHQTTRDVSKKRAQNDFLFQRAGDDQIDMIGTCGAQNRCCGLTRLRRESGESAGSSSCARTSANFFVFSASRSPA